MKNKFLAFFGSIAALAVVAVAGIFAPKELAFFGSSAESELLVSFFEVGCLFVLSFIVFYVSHATKLPSFVIAIFFGIAGHNLLVPIIEEHAILGALVGFGATLILFGGGLETPFHNFRKLLPKILSVSFIGLFVTAILFSISTALLAKTFGIHVPIIVSVLLGAVLASTDPAAIIPVLKRLRFFNRSTKDIIVSESAVTDVTGTLLTVAFLGVIVGGLKMDTVTAWYQSIFTIESGKILLQQILFGVLFGIIGYIFLEILMRFKRGHEKEFEADAAFFLFTPVIIFTVALALGGSGYLAAFIAGLLFNLTEHLHETERFFNHIIEGFFKPTIFILLGALVEPTELFAYASIGISVGLVFMFLIRPFIVFLTLGPFSFFGKERLSWRELLFISCVRETGAIPAVLLITVTSAGIGDTSGLVPIGMWVILLTLIIEPLCTPWIARKLRVAEVMQDDEEHDVGADPVVVLGTRGHSFVHRLPFVADWAVSRGIGRLLVMLCLEDAYDPALSASIEKEANAVFVELNKRLRSEGKNEIDFSFVSRTGLLHDNIKELSANDSGIVAFFVGRKMLDFRLGEIKTLSLPVYFID